MGAKTIEVLDPTAKARTQAVPLAPRVHDLNGKMIGFLWNEKPNGDILLRRIKDRLSQEFPGNGTAWHEKETASMPAAAPIIEELAETSDFVINAIGD
jgi:hypothetical protein